MKHCIKEITIDGQVYQLKDEGLTPAPKSTDGLEYKIVRTQNAGVFAGYLKSRNGSEAELLTARRLWSWAGASSLSQLSQSGTSKPDLCKFPETVTKVLLLDVIEILDVTDKAKKSIDGVKVWETK